MGDQDFLHKLHCLSAADIGRIAGGLSALPPDQAAKQVAALEELIRREKRKRMHYLFPDQDAWYLGQRIYGRDKYRKHMGFFEAQKTFMEVCAMCANRVGKSFSMGGYSVALHLTGLYPDWWPGRRFPRAVSAWAAGKTGETTRDIIQKILLGNVVRSGERREVDGTGLIPGDLITEITWKAGSVVDLVDVVKVRHVTGGISELGLKAYQQGRGSFEGTERDLVWMDEEPPIEIYNEALIRLATTNGLMLLTFTPLEGMSDTARAFLPQGYDPKEAA